MFKPIFIANSWVLAGRTVVWCHQCGIDYDIRDVKNETTHPTALHVARFDCPKGHQCEARRVWKSLDDDFLKACGIETAREATAQWQPELRTKHFSDETVTDKTRRTCLAYCLNADVEYLGIRGDSVFFADPSRPDVHLYLPVDSLTPEKIASYLAEWDRKRRHHPEDGRHEEMDVKLSGIIATPMTDDPTLGETRCPNGHDSSLPPLFPELIFFACGHYLSTEFTWNEFCITCGVRHITFRIYWHCYEGRLGAPVHNPKNFCGYCGAKMVTAANPDG